MSATVLNAAFPSGVDRDGVGRDNLRKLAEGHGLKLSFAGGRSDAITFERKSAQRLGVDQPSIVDRGAQG